MNIATRNGAIITKDGKLGTDCACCGGWYCYGNPCALTQAGYNSLWVCDVPPPVTTTLRITYSGNKWCAWEFEGGDEKGPTTAVQVTYEAAAEFSGNVTMTMADVSLFPQSTFGFDGSGFLYKCGYSGMHSGVFGAYEFKLGCGNNGKQELPVGSPWEAWLFGTFPLKRYRQGSTAMPYASWQTSHSECTTSTSGTVTYASTVGAVPQRPWSQMFPSFANGAYSDQGPYVVANPTLAGTKWTFSFLSNPFCVIEVLSP